MFLFSTDGALLEGRTCFGPSKSTLDSRDVKSLRSPAVDSFQVSVEPADSANRLWKKAFYRVGRNRGAPVNRGLDDRS